LEVRDVRKISRGNRRKKPSFQGVALGFECGGRALWPLDGRAVEYASWQQNLLPFTIIVVAYLTANNNGIFIF
jgi:hypothetical protein